VLNVEGDEAEIAFNSLSRDHRDRHREHSVMRFCRGFQLPLSGSQTKALKEKQNAQQVMLSTPSLGITIRHCRHRGEANCINTLSTPSLGITGAARCEDVGEPQIAFNSLSRDHIPPPAIDDDAGDNPREPFQLPLSGSLGELTYFY